MNCLYLWNQKVHYRLHNSPPLVPILTQINPVYSLLSLLSIYFNNIHASLTMSPTRSFSFRFLHFFPQPFPTLRTSHHPLFHHFNNIRRRAQIMKLLVTHFSPVPRYLVPLRPKHPPQHPILEHSRSVLFPYCQRPSLKTHTKQQAKIGPKFFILYCLWFSDDNGENKDCRQNGRLRRLLLNKLRLNKALIAVNASGT